MSQRGGDVQSNLRISDRPICSDLIALDSADVIISLEPMEALRYLPYLSKEGWIITSSAPFVNIPNYPAEESLNAELAKLPHVISLDVNALAKEHNLPKCANVILLGAAAKALQLIGYEDLEKSIARVFAHKGEAVVAMNINALSIGYRAVE